MENKRTMKRNYRKKSGQGLSLNYIVLAAIALIALTVIVFVFLGRIGKAKTNLDDCEAKGGNCMSTSLQCGAAKMDFECSSDDQCCFISSCEDSDGSCLPSCSDGEERVRFKACEEGRVCCKSKVG